MASLPALFFNMQSRASDITEVANKVLGLLGEEPTTDITVATPDTAAAIKLKVHLYDSIDEVQSSFYWHELIKAETIAPDPGDHYDGRKRYALPNDCLRPLGVRCTEGASLPQTTYTRMAQDSDDYYHIEGGSPAPGPMPRASMSFTSAGMMIRKTGQPSFCAA